MTDYVTLDDDAPVDVVDPFTCSACGDEFPTEKGKTIHESRMHGIKKEKPEPAKKSPASNRVTPGGGKKPPQFISTNKKFSRTSRDLTTDLAAAGVAYMAVRWITAQQVPLRKDQQELFLIPEAERGPMFKPLLDGLESFTPAVRIINTIAERFDYIQCFMLWKAYLQSVKQFADEWKEVNDHGTIGQSTKPDARTESDDGSGFVRQNGFSPADFS